MCDDVTLATQTSASPRPHPQKNTSTKLAENHACLSSLQLFQVAVGLEVERQQLEHECNTSQEEALAEESRYHFLQSLCSITEARLQSVRQDER